MIHVLRTKLAESEREQLDAYCEREGITISEAVRDGLVAIGAIVRVDDG